VIDSKLDPLQPGGSVVAAGGPKPFLKWHREEIFIP